MKNLFFLGIIAIMAISCVKNVSGKPVEVMLMSSDWTFDFSGKTAAGTLDAKVQRTSLPNPESVEKGFTLRFIADLKEIRNEQTLMEIPQILTVYVRQHNPADRERQNYPAFLMPDGTLPVLEASLGLRFPAGEGERKDMTVGIPLAMLEKPYGKHEIILNFSGIQWTLYVDGKLLDNDFAIGYPQWTAQTAWSINPEIVGKADMYFPAIQPEQQTAQKPEMVPEIQYWTPPGHNAWVGDVVTFYHEGRYHVFYLYDRRHHGSKFGRGAHYFEHLSTTDFKTWTEHKPATPIEEQWETFGTGTPFVLDGKFCISYGYHTTRIYPKEQTSLPEEWEFLEKNGYTGPFNFNNVKGFPAGSSYSVSEDGISNFRKTGVIFHPCENPSVYIDPEGKLKLLANYQSKGIWESESVDSGWKCINPDFPPGGDCTFFFRWGKYDYIIGGFNNLWSKPAAAKDTEYKSVVAEGLDFYTGVCVPAISEIPGGRFLMAAWMNMRGWGGPFVIHEMIQFPDGRIGTKWMDEITPATGKPKQLAAKIAETSTYSVDPQSFMLTFTVHPQKKDGKLGIVFLGENGEQNACEWQISPGDLRAQYAKGATDAFSGDEKSLRQGANPGYDYAIENLIGVDKPFTVRIMVKSNAKFGGSVIDTEIARQRTMLTYRSDLYVKRLLFRAEGIEIKNVTIAPAINN